MNLVALPAPQKKPCFREVLKLPLNGSLAELHRTLAPGGELVVVISSRILPVFLWDRLSRWVYDLAGQAPRPQPSWLSPFEAAGFAARFEIVEIPGASVFHILATA